MARCFVTRTLPFPALDRLRSEHDVTVFSGPLPPTPDELRDNLENAEGLLCLLTDRIDEPTLTAAANLQAISNFAVGADNIDLQAAAARNIPVGAPVVQE